MNGSIDYVRIYNHTLTAGDVAEHYATGENYTPYVVAPCNESGNVVVNILNEDYPTKYEVAELETYARYYIPGRQTLTYAGTQSGQTNYTMCFLTDNNSTMYANVYFRHSVSGGYTHKYYIINGSFSADSQQINLYNFNNTVTTSDVKLTLRDYQTYDLVPNIYATLQRFYVGDGIWRNVQMDLSDEYGFIFFHAREYDTDYRIVFRDANDCYIKSSSLNKFVCTAGVCDITTNIGSCQANITADQLNINYTYLNETGMIYVNWTDVSFQTQAITITVSKESSVSNTTICYSNVTGSTGSYACNITGNYGTILLKAKSQIAGSVYDEILAVITLSRNQIKSLIGGEEASFWSFGIVLTVVMFGIFSPVGAIITTIIGLIIVFLLGISVLSVPFIIIAAVIGIALGVKLRD